MNGTTNETLVMVLGDGETFGSVEGCSIVAVPDAHDIDDIEDALDAEGSDSPNAAETMVEIVTARIEDGRVVVSYRGYTDLDVDFEPA